MTTENLKNKIFFLSGNMLKIIAAIAMVIDHIGVMFFPTVKIYRIIGRLAYPIFAFMIAEGCRYTKNKHRYFLTIFVFAVLVQIVYYIYSKDLYMSILVTFTLAIAVIFALQNLQKSFVTKDCSLKSRLLAGLIFAITIALVILMNAEYTVDYGVWGSIAPAFAALIFSYDDSPEIIKNLDIPQVRVVLFTIGLIGLSLFSEWSEVQWYSLFAVPLLLLYSGKRGKLKMKYFFYAFYPLHLIILEIIFYFTA